MTAAAGYKGNVFVTATPSVALTQFVLTDSGDHKTFTTPTGQYAKRYWDKTATWLVETTINGGTSWSTATAGTYSIQYVGGIVTLNSALTGTPGCRVTGAYFSYSQLGDGYNWELSLDRDILDVTRFGDQWADKLPGQAKSSGKFGKYYNDNTFMTLMGSLMVFVLFTDSLSGPAPQNGPRYEAYGYINQDAIKEDVKSAVSEDVSFQIDGQAYYLAN